MTCIPFSNAAATSSLASCPGREIMATLAPGSRSAASSRESGLSSTVSAVATLESPASTAARAASTASALSASIQMTRSFAVAESTVSSIRPRSLSTFLLLAVPSRANTLATPGRPVAFREICMSRTES